MVTRNQDRHNYVMIASSAVGDDAHKGEKERGEVKGEYRAI